MIALLLPSAAPPAASDSIDLDEASARKRKTKRRVRFDDGDASSDDVSESMFDTLTMALNDTEHMSFASDAIALLNLDIPEEHIGRLRHIHIDI